MILQSQELSDFDCWLFSSWEPDGMPTMSHLLYKVCDKDPEKFNKGIELLQKAFEAGKNAAQHTTKG